MSKPEMNHIINSDASSAGAERSKAHPGLTFLRFAFAEEAFVL